VLNDLFVQLGSYSFAMCDVEIFEQIKMDGWMDGTYQGSHFLENQGMSGSSVLTGMLENCQVRY